VMTLNFGIQSGQTYTGSGSCCNDVYNSPCRNFCFTGSINFVQRLQRKLTHLNWLTRNHMYPYTFTSPDFQFAATYDGERRTVAKRCWCDIFWCPFFC